MSSFNDISAALDQQAVGLSLPISWENKDYTPKNDETYLRATLLPAGSEATGIADDVSDDHIGIYRLDVITQSGKGKGEAVELADAIADHFKRGTILTYNSVKVKISSVSRLSGVLDGSYYIIGVSIAYRAFTQAR